MATAPSFPPRFRLLLIALLCAALGCTEAPDTPPGTPPGEGPPFDPADVVAIAISPEAPGLLVGETLALEANVTLGDGSERVLTDGATWSSTAPDVATIDGDGVVTGVAMGEAVIEVALEAFRASAKVVVLDADAVASLEVMPPRVRLETGEPLAAGLVVTAKLGDGSRLDVSNQVTWSSADPSRFGVLPSGELLGLSAGWSKLIGTLPGLRLEVDVNVSGNSMLGIRLTEDLYRLEPVEGAGRSFVVEGDFGPGKVADVTALAGYDLDHAAVTVPTPGTLRVPSKPSQWVTELQITASLAGAADTARIRVSPRRLFVADRGARSVLSFALSGSPHGNVAPLQQLTGEETSLMQPVGLFYDDVHDELLVADSAQSAVTTFAAAAGLDGGVAPLRRFSTLQRVAGVAYDATRDLLYVGEVRPALNDGRVQVYRDPRAHVTGSPPAERSFTAPGLIATMAIDEATDQLFLSFEQGRARILAMDGVSVPDAPTRSFNSFASVIAHDAQRQRLYAVSLSGTIQVFPPDDSVRPIRPIATITVEGAANLRFWGAAHDPETDTLYVSGYDHGMPTILGFADVSIWSDDMEVAPVSRIDGPATLLSDPRGLVIGW